MRIVKKIALFIISIALFLSALATVLTYVFEDEIKQYAVDQLNKNLSAPVKVDQIEFSIWKRFPYASLEFNNLYIPGVYDDGEISDTMFFAKRLYMKLDVVDLVKGNYVVDHVGATDGVIKVKIDAEGNGNYNIWKSSEEESSDDMAFNLNHVALHNYAFLYDNQSTGQHYDMGIKNAILKGEFYKEVYDIDGNLSLDVENMRENNVNVLSDADARANVHLIVDSKQGVYTVEKGDLAINDLNFKVTGKVLSKPNTVCDLKVRGNDIQLSSLLSSFSTTIGSFSGYSSTGTINFDASIAGTVSVQDVPKVEASFEYSDGVVREPESGVQLSKVFLKGNYTNSNSAQVDELLIESFEGKLPDGAVSGYFKMTDFTDPLIETRLKGNLNLATAQEFLRLSSVSRVSGAIDLDADVKVHVHNESADKPAHFDVHRSKGVCSVENVDLILKGSEMQFAKMNGKMRLNNHDAVIENLETMVGSSDLNCTGTLNNLLPYILVDGSDLNIVADLHSNHTQLEDFIGSSSATTSTSAAGLDFPDDIHFLFGMDVKALQYAQFEANDVQGKLSLKDKILQAKSVRLKTAGGRLNGDLRVDGKQTDFKVASHIAVNNMDINTLFYQFENFGQTMIEPSNIKGMVSAEVDLNCKLKPNLDIDQQSILATADVRIKNGELISLSTLKEITEYMRHNKAVKTLFSKHIDDIDNRLSHIRFSEIKNQLSVKNGVVHIPKMAIESDALNLNLSGTHGFDDKIDYAFDFRFRDLKARNDDTEFGNVIDDGTGIQLFLRMYGTVDDPIFELDKTSRREHIKSEIDNEKNQTKALLQENLGLYKRDTTLRVKENKKAEPEFILYDDEDTTENDSNNDNAVRRNKRKKGKLYDKLMNKKDGDRKDSVIFEIAPF